MKVGVAHVENGQIAPTGDLISLLGGDENVNFASLLDIGCDESRMVDGDDKSRGKQGNRSKEKESDEKPPPALGYSRLGATANPVGLPILPSAGGAPWRLESGDFGGVGNAGDDRSLRLAGEATSGQLPLHMRPAIDVQTVDVPGSNRPRIRDQNATVTTTFPYLSDPDLAESSKATSENRAATVTKSIAPPNGQDTDSTLTQVSSETAGVVQPSGGSVDGGVAAPILQGAADSMSVGISVLQKYAAASNQVAKPDGGRQAPAISSGEPWSGLPAESAGGRVGSSAPLQSVVDSTGSSTAGGHGQGTGTDTHRGPLDIRDATAGGHAAVPQDSESGLLGPVGPDGSIHGYSVLMNSNHPESIRESTPNTQLKELTSPRIEDASARLLGSAMRGDLQVGVHTQAFGRVTIQTNAQGGQLTAQLSLENPRESATLAAHLPGVEQKIVQQHGLSASVRLVSGFEGEAGAGSTGRDQSGSGRRDSERYHNEVLVQPGGIDQGSSSEGRGVEPALLGGRYSVSSRLDVTV